MELGMASWFSFIAFSNLSREEWTSCGLIKISVDAHQIMTVRSTFSCFLKFAISSMSCSAKIHFIGAFFHPRAVEPFYVFLIENRLHGLYGLQPRFDLKQILFSQDSSLFGRFVAVVLEDIPGPECQILKSCQRDKIFDHGDPVFRPFAQTDRAHLGQGTVGDRMLVNNRLNPGNEGCRDRTQSRNQHTEFSFRLLYFCALFYQSNLLGMR